MSKKILIVAGESSGDLYGARLVEAVKSRLPDTDFLGVGGSYMKAAGVRILFPIDELSIIGISEIFSKINVLKTAFSLLQKSADEEKIDLAVLVNYPGFNLKLSGILKKKGIPVIFYSSPQVWAWAGWRVGTIKKYVDKMIVFFKFEEEFYKERGVGVEFIGHPLVDTVKPKGENIGLEKNPSSKITSLVPGSRKSEIKNMFGAMLDAAGIIHQKDPSVRFIVTKHPDISPDLYLEFTQKRRLPVTIVDGKTHDCLALSDLAIVVSGSVTLEAALLGTPMIITNKLSLFNALIYLLLVRLENVGLVNIIAGKRVMPELLQYNATGKKIAKEAIDILTGDKRYEKMKEDLASVNKLVGAPGASGRGAEIICGFLNRNSQG
ncbi:MAG: lipid-A-disaccharide synthase [Candidatus Omnitrophota bacterium]